MYVKCLVFRPSKGHQGHTNEENTYWCSWSVDGTMLFLRELKISIRFAYTCLNFCYLNNKGINASQQDCPC